MRSVLIAGLAVAAASPALADSIQKLEPSRNSDSILTIGCPVCVKEQKEKEAKAKLLPPGTAITEIREVNGQTLVYTTENWLGGSPVTIVRKANEYQISKLLKNKAHSAAKDLSHEKMSENESIAVNNDASDSAAIDESSVTAALPRNEGRTAEDIDPVKFKLRSKQD